MEFNHQCIHETFKRRFSYSDNSEITFSTEKYIANEMFTLLRVKVDGVEQKYILVKIHTTYTEQCIPVQISQVLFPVFIIEDNNECYGAFECQYNMEHFITPERNNILCLKTILKNLAEHQALELHNVEKTKKPKGYHVRDISDLVITMDCFQGLYKTAVKQTIKNLQVAVNNLYESSDLLVKSIWSPLTDNVYVNQHKDIGIFFAVPSTKKVPIAYDALLYIFSFSEEKFLQEHFENLIQYYFHSLTKYFQKLQMSIVDDITKSFRDHQVRVLLPIVKFKIASSFFQLGISQNAEILTNILNFLKYPLINQEDIYEITRNKIKSRDYDLLDFSLVRLNEKNGHLGEYFHLNIKIKAQDKEQELELFAKFLITSTVAMKKVLESGHSKREEFFYKTLYPLFAINGLDSLLDFAPECYLIRSDWLLIFDDLGRQGYVGFKPNSVLNYEGLRVIVEKFAKFHACTIILEEMLSDKSGKDIRLDEGYGNVLKETMLIYEEGHHLQKRYDIILKTMCYIVEKFPEVIKKLDASLEEIRSRIKKFFLSVFSKTKKSNTIRNVINHGDVFVSNMLFKYGEDNVITKGILVDFQTLRYVSPNYDLIVFLFSNSTKETRDKYLLLLIEEYYQHLTEHIRRFNYDPEVIIPKETFDKDFQFMMSAGLVTAFINVHIFHMDPDFREEVAQNDDKFEYYLIQHRDELVDLSWENLHYRNMLCGLVEDIVDIIKNDF